ncbi:hypothetical protein L227DRAFT_568553 [Lentinus tigrinus ALCF2SS1-6]|uniref:Uncharacterized protein n=1 Tax=Lentinus tigrinus ALCF2SS1-6 TaxID=1328759 RepID=A0A5C2RLQ9_9APHY|nr:hypothetical protein L227DRAFT_568553 [Lentinus tigrinus ALCF2SS1-6]
MDAPSSSEDTDWLMQSPSPGLNAMDMDSAPVSSLLEDNAEPAGLPTEPRPRRRAVPDFPVLPGARPTHPEEAPVYGWTYTEVRVCQMEVDEEGQPNAPLQGDDPNGGFNEQLERIYVSMARLHQSILEHQRITDARLVALDEHIRDMRDMGGRGDVSARGTSQPSRQPRKDSSANYLRRCLRKHAKLTLGFNSTDALPSAPSDEETRHMLQNLNHGEALRKPFQINWRDPPTSVYNVCVENSFSADFWAAVDGGQYDAALIPERYRERETFIRVYRRHIAHLKKCWTTQQNPPGESQKKEKARHYARNSRIGTTFRNRRDAARYIQTPDSGKVYDLMKAIGTVGISSDEEIASPPGQGRQYATYDKPWRASSLVHLYRHLDLIHAATRNPNGNPIRTRHRTLRVREPMTVPDGLPIDCYSPLFLNRCSALDMQMLRPKPPVGVDELWMRTRTDTSAVVMQQSSQQGGAAATASMRMGHIDKTQMMGASEDNIRAKSRAVRTGRVDVRGGRRRGGHCHSSFVFVLLSCSCLSVIANVFFQVLVSLFSFGYAPVCEVV